MEYSKVRITYNHPVKDGVTLEVVGWVYDSSDETTYVKRLDGYNIDIPTGNILTNEAVPKQ